MKSFNIKPIDTLFFRDAAPFANGSAAQGSVGGLFPPHPPTIVGAMRAALARQGGWSGQGRWSPDLEVKLGNGPTDLGPLKFGAFTLLKDGAPLYPMPQHLLGYQHDGRWLPWGLLRPGDAVDCDLGRGIRLLEKSGPETPVGVELKSLRPSQRHFITAPGLKAVLRGQLPAADQIVHQDQLWQLESRFGIARDFKRKAVEIGALYQSTHIRLADDISLAVGVGGIDHSLNLPQGPVIQLGGEGRMSHCSPMASAPTLPWPEAEITTDRQFILVALTPVDWGQAIQDGRTRLDLFGGAKIETLSVPDPIKVGGFNSLTRKPTPLRTLLPPGTVFFCSMEADPTAPISGQNAGGDPPQRTPQGVSIGMRQDWGFGQMAVGVWPSQSGASK